MGSFGLGTNLRGRNAGWQAEWVHPLELAESFADPSRFEGTVSKAANWLELGQSRGYSRSNGQYRDMLGPPKTMLVDPLRPDTRARLRAPAVLPEWLRQPRLVLNEPADWPSLLELLKEVPNPRHGPMLRDRLSAVLALLVPARVAGKQGGWHTEMFSKA